MTVDVEEAVSMNRDMSTTFLSEPLPKSTHTAPVACLMHAAQASITIPANKVERVSWVEEASIAMQALRFSTKKSPLVFLAHGYLGKNVRHSYVSSRNTRI